jgi:hypothetical protein
MTYGGVEIAPQFLTSALDRDMLSASRAGRFTSEERGPEPTGQEAGWCPQPVWTMWHAEKSLVPAGIRTPAVQSVACPYADWDFLASVD